MSGISRLQSIGAKYVVMLVDLFTLVLVYYFASAVASLLAGRGLGESASKFVGDALMMTVAIAFFISVIFSLDIILQVATKLTIIPAIFIIIWPLAISKLTIFAHWTWLKYVNFITAAESIDQIWSYIGVSLAVLALTTLGSALLISRKEP